MELFYGLIVASVLAAGLGVASLPSRSLARGRLARLSDGTVAAIERGARQATLRAHPPGGLVRWLAPLGRRLAREERASARPLRRRLAEAGYRHPSALGVYLGARLGLACLFPALLLLASPAWRFSGFELLASLAASAGLGYVAPRLWLDRRRRVRQRAIVNGLPDALDLLVVCVEAGLGINASLARVARETVRSHPCLSAEFELVTLETRAGKSSTEALRSLAERTGVAEVSSLVSMLVQTERFGTCLSDTLRVHAEGMRVRRLQRAEELAAKAPLKMLFPTLFIFVATLIVTIGPGLMQLLDFFSETSRR